MRADSRSRRGCLPARRLARLVVLAALLAALVAPAAGAQPPSLPHYFYGTLTVDGAGIPAGVTIEARVAGALHGPFNPIVTAEAGRYGSADPAADVPRLLVQGDITEGATVEFLVNGVRTNETAAWHSGQTTRLDLTMGPAPALGVSTGAASDVAAAAATLNGSLTEMMGAASAVVSFQWGMTQVYGSETPGRAMAAPGDFAAALAGLLPDTLYHYRAKAVAGTTTVFGADLSFTTGSGSPSLAVSTGPASAGTTTASLNGDLTHMSGTALALVSFEWGIAVEYGNETPGQTLTATGGFAASLTGLMPGTLYHYRARAVAGQTTSYGDDLTFRTGELSTLILAVSTGAVSSAAAAGATLNGDLAELSGVASAAVSFQWGTTPAYGNETPVQMLPVAGPFSSTLDGLQPGTLYYYRARAVAGQTITFGVGLTFSTTAALAVATAPASVEGATRAVLNGALTELSGAALALVGFEWGTTEAYGNETPAQMVSAGGSFSAALVGLLPDTLYHYRARASAGAVVVLGIGETFRTAAATTVGLDGLAADIELRVDASGKAQDDYLVRGAADVASLFIAWGTAMMSGEGGPLAGLSLAVPAEVPPAPPRKSLLLAQELGPGGATFDPPIALTLAYRSGALPPGAREEDLTIAYWGGAEWIELETTVNAGGDTVTAGVGHFTTFGVLASLPAPPPALSIAAPAADSSLPPGDIQVTVEVENFELVAPGGGNTPGQGHLHYYLDVDIPTSPGQAAVTAAGSYQASFETSATWEALTAGAHTLGVQLVNNDHTPLDPPVTASLTVTVQRPPRSASRMLGLAGGTMAAVLLMAAGGLLWRRRRGTGPRTRTRPRL